MQKMFTLLEYYSIIGTVFVLFSGMYIFNIPKKLRKPCFYEALRYSNMAVIAKLNILQSHISNLEILCIKTLMFRLLR